MKIEAYYDEVFSRNGGFASADLERAALIREKIPSTVKTVLEVGAGSGLIARQLMNDLDVDAIEVSEVGVRAMRALGIRAERGSVAALPYADRRFDLVLASEVIEHLDAPTYQAGLAEIARVASDYVLLTVPNRENLVRERQECPECRSVSSPWTHLRSFSTRSLAQTFTPFGFEAEQVEAFGPPVSDTDRVRTRLASWHRTLKNPLRPGFLCPVCGYRMNGTAFARPTMRDVLADPMMGLGYALDAVAVRLSPKKPRWLLALFRRAR